MLRVCGITYDHTTNYGSTFQAYALQEAVEQIRLSDGTECSYWLIPIRKCKDWPVQKSWKHLLVAPFLAFNRSLFYKFEQKYIHFADIHRISDLGKLNDSMDAFVCGSDVIWNPDFNLGVDSFYLDFATRYKFSYAASFGKSDISAETQKKIVQFLPSFDSLSVRERSGINTLQNSINKPAQVVCDPVFLVDTAKWKSIISKEHPGKKYIFVYITHLSKAVENILEQIQRATGFSIVHAACGPKQALRQGMIKVQTPQEWLGLLYHAEYVVTNSFHATAFSVLFHKKFFTIVNGDKAKGVNVRMNDLLTALGLEDRIFSDIPDNPDLSEPDYTAVDQKVDQMRRESLDFLQGNLEAAYLQKMKRESKE